MDVETLQQREVISRDEKLRDINDGYNGEASELKPTGLTQNQLKTKRVLDLFIVICAVPILVPLSVITAILIKFTDSLFYH